jgi:L-ascorbate metabolism protein UlaG (beta-lactamase superfamily)
MTGSIPRTRSALRITYIGGPTALLEYAGLRFLTDPTFDPAGTDYPTPAYTLHKTQTPALSGEQVGAVHAVLLSHDHHFDNLDHAGRAVAGAARAVYTTQAGAERLGGGAIGMAHWEKRVLPGPSGHSVAVTATPARHGPPDGDRGPVIGFVLTAPDAPVVYVSGDTVWYEGVIEVGRRFPVNIAILNAGAAKVAVAGPSPLTFTASEVVTLAQAWPKALIVPLHFEGWTHFSEGAQELRVAFAMAGLVSRLRWVPPGVATVIS